MIKYRVIDEQDCNFMDDTYDNPMTMNGLRARFWALDDCRANKYSLFTREYISVNWCVRFEKVD